jgi:Putative transposase of IS4/5 family (DUF4096)
VTALPIVRFTPQKKPTSDGFRLSVRRRPLENDSSLQMELNFMRYELTAIRPMLPNKPRGVPRANDRRVLNGIFWILRSGAPWRDLPRSFGPYTTCYNRFIRWRRAGV